MTTETLKRGASKAEFLSRVAELLPDVRQRAPLGDELRRLPTETVDQLLAAGVGRALVPDTYGGDDLGFDAYVDATLMLAAADASTAWVANLIMHQAVFVANFDPAVQAEIWADGPDVATCSSVMPSTKVEVVEGGYRLKGAAPFCSGSSGSTWTMLGGFVSREGEEPEWYMFLLPASDYTIKDVWHTSGMRGTGSNTIITDGVFVPAHRAVRQIDLVNGTGPGSATHADPKFRSPWVTFGGLGFSCTVVGAVQGAFEIFRENTSQRRGLGGVPLRDLPNIQLTTGRIKAQIDGAEAVLRNLVRLVDAGPITLELRAQAMHHNAFAGRLALQSMEDIMVASGTSAYAEGSPLDRIARDVRLAAAHISMAPDLAYAHTGRTLLGAEIPPETHFF